MKRAFLCHSSDDKDYIRIVAKYLGRAHVVFDEMSFEPGTDFRAAVTKGLAQSSLLCFFASQRSIASTWCQFELDQSSLLQIKGQLSSHLCLIIDHATSVGDLPEWMQSAKALFQPRSSRACRDIQHALLELYPAELKRPFVGRETQVGQITRLLSELEGPRRNLFLFTGLEGVGRRSLVSRCAGDLLGLQVQPIIALDRSAGLEDLYVWLLDDAGAIESRDALAREMRVFNDLDARERVQRIVSLITPLCQENYLPCILDLGALLTDDGQYKPEFSSLLVSIAGSEDIYLALVQRRTPAYLTHPYGENFVHIRVPPLTDGETTVLVRQLATRSKITLEKNDIENISQFVGGYPPAAYFAVGYVTSYGASALTADPSILVDFKTRRFTRFVHDLNLSSRDSLILKYMAAERPLSLDALAIALELPNEEIADSMRRMIDMSLVTVYDDLYAVSAPLRDAVERVFGFVERDGYENIVRRLTNSYWVGENVAPSVDVVDATLHALARSGQHDFAPYQDLVRPSVVERLAVECYHRQEWEMSQEYARRGLEMDPGRDRLTEFLFKSLVKLERWPEATSVLTSLEERGNARVSYLRGFLYRNQRKYHQAVVAFREALDTGDRSYPVFRDLADSLYREGQLEEAFETLKHVLDRDSENIFVLDLAVRILVDVNDFKQAEIYLKQLVRFDIDGQFVHHRRAHFRAKQGMWDLALVDAEKAVQSGRAPFQSYAEYANILIEMKSYQKAISVIDQLGSRFAQQRRDVQRGLRCKLLIRQEKWKAAKAVWDQLEEKDLPVHLHLLRSILKSKARDQTIAITEQEDALLQVEQLDRELDQHVLGHFDYYLLGEDDNSADE